MKFNIRVYGILINSHHEILLSDERRQGRLFTKFPGGGLEFGEGTKTCLVREFLEEIGVSVNVGELFYLTDFFQRSAFDEEDQLISVYYKVHLEDTKLITTSSFPFDFSAPDQTESFRWKKMTALTVDDVTFPVDQKVVELLLKKN